MLPAGLQPILERIGLNHHESRVYLTLLSHGRKPASVVARISGAPRNTIRSILDKLCRMGLVDKIYRGNTQHYGCLPPDAIERYVGHTIAERQRQLDEVRIAMPAFNAARNADSVMPTVRYFEGPSGVIEAMRHSLVTEPREILFISAYNFFQDREVKQYDVHEYLPERLRRGIRMRVLSEENPETLHWHGRAKQELREHRFLTKDRKLPGNFFLYDRFVLYFAANQGEYIATLTESFLQADTLRTLFEALWVTGQKPRKS